MSISLARIAKQQWDARTVRLTWCPECYAPAGIRCTRHGRERATPCVDRQNRGDDMRIWIYLTAFIKAAGICTCPKCPDHYGPGQHCFNPGNGCYA